MPPASLFLVPSFWRGKEHTLGSDPTHWLAVSSPVEDPAGKSQVRPACTTQVSHWPPEYRGQQSFHFAGPIPSLLPLLPL